MGVEEVGASLVIHKAPVIARDIASFIDRYPPGAHRTSTGGELRERILGQICAGAAATVLLALLGRAWRPASLAE